MLGRHEHWNDVYRSKLDAELSWAQPKPTTSLSLIAKACPAGGRILDAGGGSSPLVDRLLDRGYDVTVADVSEVALDHARRRLGPRAGRVRWIIGDVTTTPLPGPFDLWHDRAAFHFLIEEPDRRRYVEQVAANVPPGGHVIIATFALDGPERCSGLPVRRYDGAGLSRELGLRFELLQTVPELHHTPAGKPQSFQYSLFRRR